MNSGKFKFLKKFTQILLSVSLFSFLFSQSSLVPVFLHHFHRFAPNLSIKFFTFESERNYIFLLFNGILVLIIQSSGLVRKSPAKIPVDLAHIIQQKKEEEPKFHEIAEVKETQIHEDEGSKNGTGFVAEKKDFTGPDQTEECGEEGGGGGRQEIEVLSADELNKKCEEFIKKVKQEIKKT
ncbi:hypothetical protein F511_03580 [Dorcoceras hygrometricum]|uniref:Uncharacterized protein n=1 Tax=Dorcoceras hygrometricum TaxID=472368 RepID=A0A2Z7D4H5_9LAMI|nr:hypothetical protein F511_03580 [Dorcoceras hygrometricum]